MLKFRVLAAAIGIPAVLALAYLGGTYWAVFVAVLAVTGLYEFYSMAAKGGFRPAALVGYPLVLACLAVFGYLQAPAPDIIRAVFLAAMGFTGLVLLRGFPGFSVVDLALTWFGPLYLGIFFSYAILIERELPVPFFALLLAFLLTWASDTGGYFVGRYAGRHKMAPSLSPNKTWEGAAGGLLLALAVVLVCGWDRYPATANLILGAAGGVLAQVGDLVVSAMKRYFRVKDTGTIIPGHGGVLDRFDSFMWVLPLVYYYCKIFQQLP